MEFDFNTISIGNHTGYGGSGENLLKSLRGQGVTVHPGSSLMLNYCMPKDFVYSDKTIGYTCWESTEIPDSWIEPMKRVDDLWTPVQWAADLFSERIGREVFVLPLGIEEFWQPVQRERSDVFTFLHVGEPALRKGGDLVLQAWMKRFANDPKFRLIFKCIKYPACRVKDKTGSIIASPAHFNNVQVDSRVLDRQALLDLYYGADCMVYPTRGEGFGLIPFEGIASGMPTILPNEGGTADFSNYGIPLAPSKWVKSEYQNIHPGLWMDFDVDEIIDIMLDVYNNFDRISEESYAAANRLHEDYSWSTIGQKAAERMSLWI